MKNASALVLRCDLALFVFMSDSAKMTAQNNTSPVRLDREKMAGLLRGTASRHSAG